VVTRQAARACVPAAALLAIGCASLPRPEVHRGPQLVVAVPAAAPGARSVKGTEGGAVRFLTRTASGPAISVSEPGALAGSEAGPLDWYQLDVPAQASSPGPAPGGTAPSAPGEAHPGWDFIYGELLSEAPGAGPGLLGTARDQLGADLEYVEPDIEVVPPGEWKSAPPPADVPEPGGSATAGQVRQGPNGTWPGGLPIGWHLAGTQLADARAKVEASLGTDTTRVLVAHIDTGHGPLGQVTTPPRIQLRKKLFANFWDVDRKGEYLLDDARDRLTGSWETLKKAGFIATPGHGAATLSVLAGGEVRLEDGRGGTFTGELGGAPQLDLLCIRVAPTVVHLDSTRLAMAINYAVDNHADVISLSHGGLPSHLLTSVVNKAYDSGTAIFAAAGDFYELPPIARVFSWKVPHRTPSRTVWPAAYVRAMSVVGVTASGGSYGESPPGWGGWLPWKWGQWMMRGSYGPDSVMDHTIAAYSPNIPFARFTSASDPLDQIDLDGGGTSAATPQVAAAGALWLQRHRDEEPLRGNNWHSWQKTENVYRALAGSAKPLRGDAAENRRYFGAGLVQADAALAVPATSLVSRRPLASVDVPDAVVTVLLSMWLKPEQIPERGSLRGKLLYRSVALEVAQLGAMDVRVGAELERLRDDMGPGRAAGPAAAASTEALQAQAAPLRQALRESAYGSSLVRR
jgi:hypothetical protein